MFSRTTLFRSIGGRVRFGVLGTAFCGLLVMGCGGGGGARTPAPAGGKPFGGINYLADESRTPEVAEGKMGSAVSSTANGGTGDFGAKGKITNGINWSVLKLKRLPKKAVPKKQKGSTTGIGFATPVSNYYA